MHETRKSHHKMKTMTLSVLLALGGSLFVAPTADAACRTDLIREVQTLNRLTCRLEGEYRAELRETRHVCGDRAALMESLSAMDDLAGLLRRSVENGEPSCNQERLFGMVKSRFCRAEEHASHVQVCSCVRGLMSDVRRSIRTLDAMGFEVAYARPPSYERPHHDHDHGHGRPTSRPSRPPHPREIILGGLLGVLSGR